MVAYCAWVFVLFLVFLPSTGFPLSNTCTETFPINYKYFIRPLLFWKMRMISKANTHPVCLPVWIILFLRPSLPRHLSPQHCKEICSIEYWWTELYYGFFLLFFFSSFFLSVIFFFLFVLCVLKKKKKFKWINLSCTYIKKKNTSTVVPVCSMAFFFSFLNPCRLVSFFVFVFFYFVKIYKY